MRQFFSHLVIAFLAAALASGLTLHYMLPQLSSPQTPSTAPLSSNRTSKFVYSGQANVVDAVKRLGPAVVNINTESVIQPSLPGDMDQFFNQFFGDNPFRMFSKPYKSEGAGSGVIISSDGLVVTNEHVIHKASAINVTLTDNRKFEAKVVGSDPLSDIAVLRLQAPPKNLPVAELGDSDHLQIGEWLVAIGNPYGFHNTVTVGVLSAEGRSISGEDKQYLDLLQTDAAINPGNSGGPCADLTGAVIGINSAIIPFAQGIGFAIPINLVKKVVDQLIKSGHMHWPFLGINMQTLTPQIEKYLKAPTDSGVVVVQTVPHSPAEKAGLKQGDIIIEIGGQKVENPDDLTRAVRNYNVGDKITLKFYRDGKLTGKELILAERPQ